MSHIALVAPGLDHIGGAERQLLLLAHGLRRRGWRVTVVALTGNGGQAAAELQSSGVGFLSLHMRKGLADPRGWLRFHRWLLREMPEVVQAHLPHAAWLARWSRLCAPVRVLVDRLHTTSTGGPGRRLGYRISRWLPDRVTAVSVAVAETHLAARMVSPSRLIVLPNGVDPDFWRPDPSVRHSLRSELGLSDEFLWLAAGRLAPVKDYPTLLAALAALPAPTQLVIAGEGPLQKDLVQLSARLGLQSRLRFLDFEPNLRRWMQAADGFVLSSLWEGLPMVLLEAAACALPAVATNTSGTRALSALLAGPATPPGDAVALARAMQALMLTPAPERRHIGQEAHRIVAEQFSLDAALNHWESLYERLLAANTQPRRWGQASTIQAVTDNARESVF